jgi:hypothetical protein
MALAVALATLAALGSPAAANPEPTPVVVGIVLREVGPAFAVIQDPATSKAGFYGIGSPIGAALVAEILADRVILVSGDQRTLLRLATPVGPAPARPSDGPERLELPDRRPKARVSGLTVEAPSPYARIAAVSVPARGATTDGGERSATPAGIAGPAGGPASSGTQGCGNASLAFTGHLQDGTSLSASRFSAASLRDLRISVTYENASCAQRQRIELRAPDGSLYQRLSGGVAPVTETLIPVGGTWITSHSLLGDWRVDVYVDLETAPIVSRAFVLAR